MGIWTKQGVVLAPIALDNSVGLQGVANATIRYDPHPQILSPNADGKIFKMWYGGDSGMGYAESADASPGSWVRQSTIAYLIANFTTVKVFHNGSTYYAYGGQVGWSSIVCYTSPDTDGINWTLQGTSLTASGGTNWDGSQIYYLMPFLFSGGLWYGSYTGVSTAPVSSVGIATSADLITWSRPTSPVITDLIASEIHKVGSTYYMWGCLDLVPPLQCPSNIGRSSSTDLSTWTVPITTIPRTLSTEGVNIVGGQLCSPSIIEVNGTSYCLYTGTDDEGHGKDYQIFLATAPFSLAEIVISTEGITNKAFYALPAPSSYAVAATYSKAFDVPNIAGDMLVVIAHVANSGTVDPTIADTNGNVWTSTPKIGTTFGAIPYTQRMWYCANCKNTVTGDNGINTITVSTNNGAQNGAIICSEYINVGALDQSHQASPSAGNSGNIITTIANELLLGFWTSQASNMNSWVVGSGGSGTTLRENLQATLAQADNFVSVTGTYHTAATVAGDGASQIFSFYSDASYISGSAGIAGATVSYSGTASGSVIADSSGNYLITGLINGIYTITLSKTGYTFSPNSASETVNGADITGVDFVATQTLVATPTFSPVAGSYGSAQNVTISSTDSGLSGFAITYTTDGTTPVPGSHGTVYSTPVVVSSSLTIKAVASATGYANSTEADAAYTIITGYTVSGSVGVAGATISYTGPSSGSVTSGAGGTYSITGLQNGTYVLTPSLTGYLFAPTSITVVVSGSNVSNVNYQTSNHYSVPDCRVAPFGPNQGVYVQGTIQYTGQTSDNAAIPPVDSRAAGAPVDSRAANAGTTPQNSRAPGTFGPGE